MCGICGVANLDPLAPVDVPRLLRMRDSMIHRGPDDAGMTVDAHVGLGHRRLSIIDLAGGHQPMPNADETLWITYNGEIYNFKALRALLEARGYGFRTKSDTEVILAAYEAFGERCVEHLRGMFAFAIWDRRRSQLLLARDRLGIKPLYYTVQNGALLFASEIKAILQWPGVTREVDTVALTHYLGCRYVPGPRTMFKGILKLQPGHLLILREGAVRVAAYWDLPTDAESLGEAEATRQLRRLLDETVGSHLVSDVPLGVFLSGGLDSTAVTGCMARMVSDPIQSFSVGYPPGAGIDETPFARLAATRFGTEHRDLRLEAGMFWNFLPRMVWYLDEPVADPAAVPLYFLAEFARKFVTVALSGEGADELFAGYAIYRKMLLIERLRRVPGLGLMRGLDLGGKLGRYVDRATRPLEACYRGVAAVFGKRESARLLRRDLARDGDEDFAEVHFAKTRRLDPLRKMLYFDTRVWLPDNLLVKADKMTMAASLELRVPFLDHRLVEWAWRLPSGLKLKGTTGKYLLREATSDLVPREILRRSKEGFTVPTRNWFRRGLGAAARELLVRDGAASTFFDPREVGRLIRSHESGRRDVSEALFALVVFACWARVFLESPGELVPPGEGGGPLTC